MSYWRICRSPVLHHWPKENYSLPIIGKVRNNIYMVHSFSRHKVKCKIYFYTYSKAFLHLQWELRSNYVVTKVFMIHVLWAQGKEVRWKRVLLLLKWLFAWFLVFFDTMLKSLCFERKQEMMAKASDKEGESEP